jgi:hypothetical protein
MRVKRRKQQKEKRIGDEGPKQQQQVYVLIDYNCILI